MAFLGQGFPFRYFSAREKDSYIRKKKSEKQSGTSENASKTHRPPQLSWAKKGGQLTTHARGVVFGMHIAGMSALATADRMDMTPNGVRHSIAISETIVHGGRDETIPSAPTTPSPKKKEIAKRRRRVDALLRKRGRDGNPVIGSARDMQRALLEEGVEVDRSTVTRDMVATGARFLARPTTADHTEAHKQTRVELGRDLLQVDPNVIITRRDTTGVGQYPTATN